VSLQGNEKERRIRAAKKESTVFGVNEIASGMRRRKAIPYVSQAEGQPLSKSAWGLRKRSDLMEGESRLFAEKQGGKGQKRSVRGNAGTFNRGNSTRRKVILERDAERENAVLRGRRSQR